MLDHISIRNFALVDRLEVDFEAGLTVITGETGAGKSIIFDAVSILTGARASADWIRAGEDQASIEAVISIAPHHATFVGDLLRAQGIEVGTELVVRRTISRSGANRTWVNDTMTTVALLQRLMEPMIQIVGQNEHLTLTRIDSHRELVDAAGDYGELLRSMADAHRSWLDAGAAIRRLEEARADRGQRLEFLRFQQHELQALRLKPGEFEALERDLSRARVIGKLREAVRIAMVSLEDGQPNASSLLGKAIEALHKAPADDRLADVSSRLAEVNVLLGDAVREVSSLSDDLAMDVDVDEMESRHEAIRRCFRKFGLDEASFAERLRAIGEEIATLDNFEDALENARKEEGAARGRAEALATELADQRSRCGARLFEDVERTLGQLAMPHARLRLKVPRTGQLTSTGYAGTEIQFSANLGEEPGPLGRIASGGELSRLLLALRASLAATDEVATYIFDEVDTGIGGATATTVGRLLRQVGAGRQVLCVTHLAQIATWGDRHLRVTKIAADGRTTSALEVLKPRDREQEIARMIGGENVSKATLSSAREMLSSSRAAGQP